MLTLRVKLSFARHEQSINNQTEQQRIRQLFHPYLDEYTTRLLLSPSVEISVAVHATCVKDTESARVAAVTALSVKNEEISRVNFRLTFN